MMSSKVKVLPSVYQPSERMAIIFTLETMLNYGGVS